MSVILKLTFDSIEEAQEFLASKIKIKTNIEIKPTPPAVVEAMLAAAKAEANADSAQCPPPAGIPPAPVAATAKRGRKPSKPSAPQAPAQEPALPPDGSAAGKALTTDDVRAALMKVNDKFGENGLAKVAELLAPFGVQKINELKPEQFPNVIGAAEAALEA